LNSLGTVSKIGVWGRSMGAATAIMYMSENHDVVSAAILDSGFSSV
jgi:dienelactone hydrolase